MHELQQRMSSREFGEWLAYFREMEPFGDVRNDIQAAIIATTVANVNRNPKQRSRPFEVKDFMPKFGTQETMTPQQVYSMFKGWALMNKGGDDGDSG